jgi:hypothetical protein
MSSPFCIKKLTNSSVLKPGQLLVVLHCLDQCGFEALFDLRKSIRIGVVQLYRHRREPTGPRRGALIIGRRFSAGYAGVDARAWSLAIYSFVFRDSAPKARYQNSLGQAKAGFGP